MHLFVDGLQLLGKPQVTSLTPPTQVSLSKRKYPSNEFEKTKQKKM